MNLTQLEEAARAAVRDQEFEYFHSLANPQTVLKLIEVVRAARKAERDVSLWCAANNEYGTPFAQVSADLRSALSRLGEQGGKG